jgi:hypothetical protein
VLNELLEVIIPYFDKITHKLANYLLWKEIVNKMKNKEHLTYEGILEIVGIRASINTGLSKMLNHEFSNVILTPFNRKSWNTSRKVIIWMGEGSLFLRVSKSGTNIGSRV